MSAAAVFIFAVLVSLLFGAILAVAVWNERDSEPMHRADAERRARKDIDETTRTEEDSRWE